MTYAQALLVLARHRIVGAYFGPGYYSWTAVQEYMAAHPRGCGLVGQQDHELYAACRVYQAERSRSRSYAPRPVDAGAPPR